ncbi:hypothetical protein B0F90DRAFT_434247 [Multifurca ochricompacta]|uniref:Uncharacterized protein n=1 Tax=Multifurca ochricompacta TaxID=376703 RepID=A0AAD4M431_9AGAM|nr:hypothetical protein B0F90DRAFT_434247 [Multifurca ochricompacta]
MYDARYKLTILVLNTQVRRIAYVSVHCVTPRDRDSTWQYSGTRFRIFSCRDVNGCPDRQSDALFLLRSPTVFHLVTIFLMYISDPTASHSPCVTSYPESVSVYGRIIPALSVSWHDENAYIERGEDSIVKASPYATLVRRVLRRPRVSKLM